MAPMTTNVYTEPGPVIQALGQISNDLATSQNEWETAAYDVASLTRDWEKRLAECRLKAEGSAAEERKAQALLMAINDDDGLLYTRLTVAQATLEGVKARVRVLETRGNLGMAILKAHGRVDPGQR